MTLKKKSRRVLCPERRLMVMSLLNRNGDYPQYCYGESMVEFPNGA